MFDEKQDAIEQMVHRVYPDVVVVFDLSRRAKRLLGRCCTIDRTMKFYRPLFKYTLESCLHCALHEVAHLMQYEISGRSSHNAEFVDIKNMLIADYGNDAIMQAKWNRQNSYSKYTLDKEQIGE